MAVLSNFSFVRKMSPANRFHLIGIGVILLVLLPLPFLKPAPAPLYPLLYASRIFAWITGGTLLLLITLGISYTLRYFSFPKSRLYLLGGLWLGSKLLSLLFSLNSVHSLFGGYGQITDGILFALVVLIFILACVTLRPTLREQRIMAGLFLLQTSILSCILLYQTVRAGFPAHLVRLNTALGNSDYFISYALLMLPLYLALAYGWWKKKLRWLSLVTCIGFIVTLAALFVSLPLPLQHVFLHRDTSASAETLTSPTDFLATSANQERFTQWKLGLQMGEDHPLFGTGPGTTAQAFYDYTPTLANWDYPMLMARPHNDLIEQFAQTGLLGLAVYLLLWVSIARAGVRRYRQAEGEHRLLLLAFGSGLALFLFFNLFLFTTAFSGLIAALFIGFLLTEPEIAPPVPKDFRLLWTSWGVVLLFCPFTYLTIQHYRADEAASQAQIDYANHRIDAASTNAQVAVARFPEENYYHYLASNYLFLKIAEQPGSLSSGKNWDRVFQEDRQALAGDPQNPTYILNAGSDSFLTAANAQTEKAGFQEILRAFAVSPWDTTLLQKAIIICTLRGSSSEISQHLQQLENVLPATQKTKMRELFSSMYPAT